MRCPATHDTSKRTRTIHLRITTFSGGEWAFDAFNCGALSVPDTALANGRVRKFFLTHVLSVMSRGEWLDDEQYEEGAWSAWDSFLLNRVIFLRRDQPLRGSTWLSWAHEVRGARFVSPGANANESSLQFYVTMPIRVI